LGVSKPFLFELVDIVVQQMGPAYPELSQASSVISEIVQGEEDRFIGTLDQGLPMLDSLINEAKAQGKFLLSGESVFKLYDTYGFPLDLVEEAALEKGLSLDHDGYQEALENQRERARKSATFSVATTQPHISELNKVVQPTQFVGYDRCTAEGVVQAILKDERTVNEAVQGDEIELVLDKTPFYPEGGGQIGDQGLIIGPACRVQIRDTTKVGNEVCLHKGVVLEGQLRVGDPVNANVNRTTRQDAARNHTATHLVHAALRDLLGPHVKQYGSLVAPNRLRFDFAHFKPLSSRDVDSIESLVNEQIQINTAVETQVMNQDEAIKKGALAFFGDKYGDQVRVVGIGSFSKELCGGTHCEHTGEVGEFRIVSEGGVAAGVRRIEALTGMRSLSHAQHADASIRELAALLKTSPGEVVSKTKKMLSLMKENERELERLKLKVLEQEKGEALVDTREIQGVQVQIHRTDGLSMQELRALSDKVRNTLSSGVLVLVSVKEEKVSLLVIVTKDLISRIKAGDLAKYMAEQVGGSGGGRPEMAQAGGSQPEMVESAVRKAFEFVEKRIGKG
ncbi:MAG: alanine--tRNA ligase, partial [Nitrospirales bacterium]|nr:alanine--tRNA ligase [Nitrospirales bacterium]